MRIRSWHFVVTGGLGGLAGFALMELVAALSGGGDSRLETIASKAVYFAGFGLAVGAALGMTEGWVRHERSKLLYGLFVGLILGAAGGAAGGAVGQAIFGLYPVRYASASSVDLALALDSSGSMKMFGVFGSDPWGKRREAATKLVDRLSRRDRVAIVDFDGQGQVTFPLTALTGDDARRAAKAAIAGIDDSGATNIDAGLSAAFSALLAKAEPGRPQHVIFLTDGKGEYHPSTLRPALDHHIRVHTIGLGSGVDGALLESIAQATGGSYHPVERAADLIAAFDQIFSQNIDMTVHASGAAPAGAEQVSIPAIHTALRVLSWAIVGLALGFGQGVRENTREDLRACSLGGFFGGALGGALFDPVSAGIDLGGGLVGRALADVVVGAAIGGAMRIAQARIVERSRKPTTALLSFLPQRPSPISVGARAPGGGDQAPGGRAGSSRPGVPTFRPAVPARDLPHGGAEHERSL
jgi:von Willebrand factor type A domain